MLTISYIASRTQSRCDGNTPQGPIPIAKDAVLVLERQGRWSQIEQRLLTV
jgi:hypothetical protein